MPWIGLSENILENVSIDCMGFAPTEVGKMLLSEGAGLNQITRLPAFVSLCATVAPPGPLPTTRYSMGSSL